MKLDSAKFHFIGIGGIGMCGLAELLHNMGAHVTGSDLAENANTERLKKLGIEIKKGHLSENIKDVDVVVYSSAINFSNPEIIAAKSRSIPLIPRAEALAEIMRLRRGIAVAGAHGKTTTTSLISSIFLEANREPTIVVGGRFERIKSTALLGKGEWLIAEADESDGSFNKLSPEIAVITNIDSDHMEYFKTFENIKKAFLDFSYRVPFYGMVIACGDDPVVREVLENYNKRILYYGFKKDNDFILTGEKGVFQVHRKDITTKETSLLGEFKIKIPGVHNALNSLAALATGLAAGLEFKDCAKGLEHFEGVDRRFHFKGSENDILVYDDYGHHPTEVKATMQAFKEKFDGRRLVVYFQPHRYSRTQNCWQDFKQSFQQADYLFLGDIYPAGEQPIPGVTSIKMVEEMNQRHVVHAPAGIEQIDKILQVLKPNDVFVTLGAGDGWKLGLNVLERLKKR